MCSDLLALFLDENRGVRIELGNPDGPLQGLLDDGEFGVVGQEERCSPDMGLGMGLLPATVKPACEGEVEREDECEEAEDQKQIEWEVMLEVMLQIVPLLQLQPLAMGATGQNGRALEI